MARVIESGYSSDRSENSQLLRKLVLIFLLVTALAFWLVVLFISKPGYPEWMQNGLAVGCISLAAALGSRIILMRRHWFIRFIATVAAMAIGLYMMGAVSSWKYGIWPFMSEAHGWDWRKVAQIVLGLYLVLLGLGAWRKRKTESLSELLPKHIEPRLREISPTSAKLVASAQMGKPNNGFAQLSRKNTAAVIEKKIAYPMGQAVASRIQAQVSNQRSTPLRSLQPPQPALKVKHKPKNRQKGRIRTIGVNDLPVRYKTRKGRGNKPKLQFAVMEDHRCPYCLDPVSQTDPRGVVECEICHALHHKDCWNITGFCQVPHLNS